MENSVVVTPSLSLHIFGLVESSAEGWQGVVAIVIIVMAILAVIWQRYESNDAGTTSQKAKADG
jgi:hypothetical protein